jgi:outer membrane immunogenic protein
MKYISILTVAIASLTAFSAQAQTANQFDGLAIGLQSGLHRNKANVTAPGNVTFTDKQDGYALRALAGYDRQMADRFVLGGEIGISRGGPETNGQLGTASFSIDPGMMFDVSARAGVVAAERVLVYGRVGYANSKPDFSAANSTATPSSFSRDKRDGGLLYGVGAEVALADSIGMRIEYRRTKFSELKVRQFLIGAVVRF